MKLCESEYWLSLLTRLVSQFIDKMVHVYSVRKPYANLAWFLVYMVHHVYLGVVEV